MPTQVSGKRDTFFGLNNRRHFLQVNLVHDPVTRRNHTHVLKRGFTPFYKVKTVFVSAIFNRSVFIKRFAIKTRRVPLPANGQQSIEFRQLGFTLAGSPPWSAIASLNPAKSTKAV